MQQFPWAAVKPLVRRAAARRYRSGGAGGEGAERRYREREGRQAAAADRAERAYHERDVQEAAAGEIRARDVERAAMKDGGGGSNTDAGGRRSRGERRQYERADSTKMRAGDSLCPENLPLIDELGKYAELQRRRGNIELYDWYTTPAVGVLDHLRKWAGPIRASEDTKELRLKFLPVALKTDLKEKLDEYFLHGNIAELDEDPAITARRLFLSIPGLMHLADDFVMKGFRSIEDLLKSEYAARWSTQQLREVQYFEDMKSKPRCQEGVLFGMLVKDHLHEFDPDLIFSETGAFRRREIWAKEGEVRFLVSHPRLGNGRDQAAADEEARYFHRAIHALKANINGGDEWEIWLENANSVMLKARIPPVFYNTRWRKVVIRFVPYAEWVPQLIDATGHGKFTERLALRAAEKGYTLTPTAIFNSQQELVTFKTEEEFFAAIQEPFIHPWDRTEQGPQLHRRNNQFQFVDGVYKEKPRAHRVKNSRGTRPSYHELLRKKDMLASAANLNRDFDFSTTLFKEGFDSRTSFREAAKDA